MEFSQKEIKRGIKETRKDLVKDILKTMCDYRISEYTSAYFATIFCTDLLSIEQMLIHIGYCLSKIVPFIINECVFTFENDFDTAQYIKLTDEYKKINNLYEEYIDAISKLIKEFGNLDIYEIGILYTILLKSGFLSKNKSFEHRKCEDYNINISRILGTRIPSGFGVCRHEAYNLRDVYNKLGYNTEYISCKSDLHSSIFKNHPVLFSHLNRQTHAVVGVKSDKEYLIFDPTLETFGGLSKNNENIIELRKFFGEVNDILYYVNFKDNNENFIEDLRNIPSYLDNNSSLETIEKFKKIRNSVINNKQDLLKWHSIHAELMEEISSLEKLLSGYKDDVKIKKKIK